MYPIVFVMCVMFLLYILVGAGKDITDNRFIGLHDQDAENPRAAYCDSAQVNAVQLDVGVQALVSIHQCNLFHRQPT